MKTYSLLRNSLAGMLQPIAFVAALLLLIAAPSMRAASAAELLEKGIYAEETKGELKDAAELYRQIVDDPQASRALVAQAQLRYGLVQLKLGNKPQAIAALERLTREFPDKDKLLAVVEQYMPQMLDDMLRQIEQNYIQEVDRGELMETALRAIVGKLDGRGLLRADDLEFLDPNQVAELNVQLEQKLAGIGVVLKAQDAGVVVGEAPLPGSPALEGGLLAGDRIVTIDGTPLPQTNQIEAAVTLLRGPAGTPVTLGLRRGAAAELMEVNLVRNTIHLPTVFGERRNADNPRVFMLDDRKKIGYIRLASVGKQSPAEMKAALDELTARDMKALILDLRNNPGGALDGAVAISDLFVERGKLLTVKGRQGETVYNANAVGTFSGFQMTVLVNGKTASAAEIIAACLQDHQRAVVVGERTFGQGIVRGLFPLKNGMGTLKLPVASYFRPSGRTMNRYPDAKDSEDWGVTPNDGHAVAPGEDAMVKALAFLETRLGGN